MECSFKKEFLKNTTILYVEDDRGTREEAFELFDGFFKKVITAEDGEEGFRKFKEFHSQIDVVLTDINMPNVDGLELLSKIRATDWEIPVLITTGFEKSDVLIKLIKFNVTNYIVKPMQLNTTFKIISLLMEEKERKKKVRKQENELKQFMSILDSINLVCEIDLEGNIIYANDLYLLTSGYSFEEIKKIKHCLINTSSRDCSSFVNVQKAIEKGQSWSGDCKKTAKDGSVYYTYSTILPIFSNNSEVKKYIEFATLTTKYKSEILLLKKQIVSVKSKSFQSSLENKSKETLSVDMVHKYQKQIDDSVNNSQQLLMELYENKKRNTYLEKKLQEQEKRLNNFQSYHHEKINEISSNKFKIPEV